MLEHYYDKDIAEASAREFRSKGYVAEGRIRNARGEDFPLARLPPFLRTLLVTDGTVTRSLEAYFWEPVRVDSLFQQASRTSASIRWLALEPDHEVLIRKVRLRGESSGRIFAFASSLLSMAAIPTGLRQPLLDREIGIGELIRDFGEESFREILEMGTDTNEAYTMIADEHRPRPLDFVYRSYRISFAKRPTILVTENFPLELYRNPPPVVR